MTSQLRRQRSTRRAPVDQDQYDDDYDDYEEGYDDEAEAVRPRRGDNSRNRGSRTVRPRDDGPEEERPAPRRGGSRSRADGDSGETRARPRRSDRDDERPAVSRGRGWDTLRNQRAKKIAGNAHRLQVKEKEVVLHFLEPEPFAVYEQHWVGQRSYTCPEKSCPMCDIGLETRTLALFNVVDMKSGETLWWDAGPAAAKRISERADKLAERDQAINKVDLYFAVAKDKQSNGFYDYSVTPVKERDLTDDYGLDPLSDEEYELALNALFDDSVIPYTSNRDLRAAAEGDDDDD